MTFTLLIIGMVIGIISTLVTLILSIVHLAGGKSRSGIILGVSFLMSVIVVILSIVELVQRSSSKIVQGVEWLKKMDEKNNKSNAYDYNYDPYYYAHIPEWNKDTVKAEFYYSMSETDSTRYIPLVYPYRFVCKNSKLESGSLESFRQETKNAGVNELKNITYFVFNDKMLLAVRSNSADQFDSSYILFDFETAECKVYENEKQMEAAAEAKGFTGEKFRESFSNHYWKYNDSLEYD